MRGDYPPPRAGSSLVAVGGSLYLFGGISHATGWFDDLYKFDTGSQYKCFLNKCTKQSVTFTLIYV